MHMVLKLRNFLSPQAGLLTQLSSTRHPPCPGSPKSHANIAARTSAAEGTPDRLLSKHVHPDAWFNLSDCGCDCLA